MKSSITIGVVLAVALLVTAVAISAQPKAIPPQGDPTAACGDMMLGRGVTDEGKTAMRNMQHGSGSEQPRGQGRETKRSPGEDEGP